MAACDALCLRRKELWTLSKWIATENFVLEYNEHRPYGKLDHHSPAHCAALRRQLIPVALDKYIRPNYKPAYFRFSFTHGSGKRVPPPADNLF